VEVRYENFINQPLETVSTLYKKFNLNGYQEIVPSFETYLATQKTIHMDHYTFSDSIKKKIENHWGFALTEYEYTRPQEETS
jgi:hypothetical protein